MVDFKDIEGAHLVVPQFVLCGDLTYPQILNAASICGKSDGAKVINITCGGEVSSGCDYLQWLNIKAEESTSDSEGRCRQCKQFVGDYLKLFPDIEEIRLDRILKQLVSPKLTLAACKTALDSDLSIKQIVLSSFASHFKLSSDFSYKDLTSSQEQKLIEYTVIGTHVFAAFRKLFAEYRPKSLHIWNGRFIVYKAIMEAAREASITCFTYERGPGQYPIVIANQSATYQIVGLKRLFMSGKCPFDFQEAKARIEETVLNRVCGTAYWSFNSGPKPESRNDMLEKAAGRPVVSIFTSSDYEFSMLQGIDEDLDNGLFDSQWQFLEWLGNVARKNPDVFYVIRIHPNEGRRSLSKQVGESQSAKRMKSLFETTAENVYVVGPDEGLSSYILLGCSALSVVYWSSMGLDASMLGVPAIAVGSSPYCIKGAVISPESRDDMEQYVSLKKRISKDEVIRRSVVAWIMEAARLNFGIWKTSGMEVKDYRRGEYPHYRPISSGEQFSRYLEKAPSQFLQKIQTGEMQPIEPMVLTSNDLEWNQDIPSLDEVKDTEITETEAFLKLFWTGRSGFPYFQTDGFAKHWQTENGVVESVAEKKGNQKSAALKKSLYQAYYFIRSYLLYRYDRPFIRLMVHSKTSRIFRKYMPRES